jgi:hypothetical protein
MQEPAEGHEAVVADALANLEAMGDRLRGTSSDRRGPEAAGRPFNIDPFVLEIRWRMANRRRALEEDAKILKDTALMMEVQAQ